MAVSTSFPGINAPIVDPRTGALSPLGLRFMLSLYQGQGGTAGTTSVGVTVASNPSSVSVAFGPAMPVAPGTYTLIALAPYALTLTGLVYSVGNAGGSFDATVTVGGTPVSGLTGVVVSSATPAIASASQAVAVGGTVDVVIANVAGAPVQPTLTLQFQRAASIVVQPSGGTSTGTTGSGGTGSTGTGGTGSSGTGGETGSTGSTNTLVSYPQPTASAMWTINHGLGRYPEPVVIDSAGEQQFGDVKYPSANTLTITFSAPFAGTAYLE